MTQENKMDNGNGVGAMVRSEQFGGQQMATVQETASTAVAAQAKAAVEARWIVAMRQPRNLDQVRSELLRECKRPSFAQVARYRKPVGQGIEGLSIRFVEQALQCMGNVDSEAITIYDDPEKRIVEVRVTDFERNVCHRKQITVTKTVERRYLKKGQTAIGRRTNSTGQTTYIVQATDDDLLNKEAALVSKALRTCGLRLIPGWLQDEAETQIKATAEDQAAKDPDQEKRALADAFSAMNVYPEDLESYMGHSLAKVSPGELVELRKIYTTIKDEQATWSDILAHRQDQRGEAVAVAEATEAAPPSRGVAAVKAHLAKHPPEPPPSTGHPVRDAQVAINESAPAARKRPSRSKAAKEARMDELDGHTVTDRVAAQQYVMNGSPDQLAKAVAPVVEAPVVEVVAEAPVVEAMPKEDDVPNFDIPPPSEEF